MEQSDKLKWGLWAFGIILGIICVAGLVYSLFHPVLNGPEPPDPWQFHKTTQQPPSPS